MTDHQPSQHHHLASDLHRSKTWTPPVWLIALLAVFFVAPLWAQTTPKVDGVVHDAAGQPLAEVEVRLEPMLGIAERDRQIFDGLEPEPIATTTTDAAGRFEVQAPEIGFYSVRLTKPGYGSQFFRLEPLIDDRALPVVKLAAAERRQVVMRDAQGEPVVGLVIVSPVTREPSPGARWLVRDWKVASHLLLSDAEGRVVVDLDPEISGWWVEASAPGHAPHRQRWSSGKTLRCTLTPGVEREVVVVDGEGEPVAEALVLLDEHQIPVEITDDRGRALLRLTSRAAHEVVLRTPTGASGRTTLPAAEPPPKTGTDAAAAIEPVELSVQTRPLIVGKITEAEGGAPIPNALVWEMEDGSEVFTRTDSQGQYHLAIGSLEGRVRGEALGFSGEGGSYSIAGAAANAAGTAPGPTIALNRSVSVSGRVIDPRGEVVANAEIYLELSWRTRRLGRFLVSRSDAQGAFRVSQIQTQLGITVEAEATGFARASQELKPLEGGEHRGGIELQLRQGIRAVGWVVDELEAPVAGAEIQLVEQGQQGMRSFLGADDSTPSLFSDAEGRFVAPTLLPGAYDLNAKASGFAPMVVRGIEVVENAGEVDLGTLVLAPGISLEGQVVDPKGQPVDGAEVMVSDVGRMDRRRMMARFGGLEPDALTDRAGHFSVVDRTPGESLEVAVAKEGYLNTELGAVTLPTEGPLKIVLKPGSRVLGRVLDPNRQPVAEAQLLAHRDGAGNNAGRWSAGAVSGVSRDDGTFELVGVEPGLVTVVVEAAGYKALRLSGVEVPETAALEDLELVLEGGASLTGTVFDAEGEPATEAFVMLTSRSGGRGNKFAQTDGEGKFKLEGLSVGAQMLRASTQNGASSTKAVEIEPGENQVELRIAGGVEVRGRVLAATGEPVPGASIEVRASSRGFFRRESVTSDDTGAFVLEEIPPGRYRIEAHAKGHPKGETEVFEVAESPLAGIDVTLPAGITITGRVLGLEPEALPKARVRLQSDRWRSGTNPDFEGRYRLENVAAGEQTLIAEVEGSGQRVEESVTLEEGIRQIEVDLEFGDGFTVTGTVFHRGERLSGADLQLQGLDVTYRTNRVVSTHEGTFRFAGVPEGRFRLTVRDRDSAFDHREEVEIRGDEDLRIEIVSGEIAGRVVLDGGEAAAGVQVRLESISGDRRNRTEADIEGRFRFAPVAEGTWRLKANKAGYQPAEEVLELEGGAVLDTLELRLEPAAGLSLLLRPASGSQPAFLRVSFLGLDGASVADGTFQSDDEGRVLIDEVPEGSWRMVLTAPGFALVDTSVTVPGEQQTIDLFPEARLAISVPGLAEQPAPARLSLVGPSGQRPWLERTGQVTTERELEGPRLEVRYLLPGPWTATVTTEDGRSWTGQVVAPVGATTTLELE